MKQSPSSYPQCSSRSGTSNAGTVSIITDSGPEPLIDWAKKWIEMLDKHPLAKKHFTLMEENDYVVLSNGKKIKALSLAAVELQRISIVLDHLEWNISDSAKILGITRATLYDKIKVYSITKDSAKQYAEGL